MHNSSSDDELEDCESSPIVPVINFKALISWGIVEENIALLSELANTLALSRKDFQYRVGKKS